jgi:hypothetical protein
LTLVSIAANLALRRGYPLEREMLPFYPLFVFIAADALDYIRQPLGRAVLCALLSIALCVRFAAQINMRATRDWDFAYRIHDEIAAYLKTHAVFADGASRKKAAEFLETYDNPISDFYGEKFGILEDN